MERGLCLGENTFSGVCGVRELDPDFMAREGGRTGSRLSMLKYVQALVR